MYTPIPPCLAPLRGALIAAVSAALLTVPAAAQQREHGDRDPRWLAVFPSIGSSLEDTARVAQLLGTRALGGELIRSPSATLAQTRPPRLRPQLDLFFPELELGWNSDLPHPRNDGALWGGRGLSARVLFGFRAAAGPLSVVVAPEYLREENQDFDIAYEELWRADRHPLAAPWYLDPFSADRPLRFGAESRKVLLPGQSSATVELGPLAAGVSTENQWWGPGVRNALVMGSHAPGIPHVFLRSARPWRTPVGAFEAKWITGRLRESEFFDEVEENDHRVISAAALTYSPPFEPNLALGVARAVYAPIPAGEHSSHLAEVFTRWDMQGDFDQDTITQTREQILSLFGRWALPKDGLEVYAEWARQRLPLSLDDLMEHPGFSQAYTVGLQSARRVRRGGVLRIAGEVTNLEQTGRGRRAGTYYTSPRIDQGYTHEGQVIGAAIGPGSSSQWAGADYLGSGWRAGIFGGRIRWDNDTYYRKPYGPNQYYGHDVSLYAGVRLGLGLPWVHVDTELTDSNRYNYLYQNFASGWANADSAIDVRNRMIRLVVRPNWPARAQPAPPVPVLPPPFPTPSADTVLEALPIAPDTAASGSVSTPGGAAAASDSVRGGQTVHLVGRGETFFGIARRYGVSLDALRAANPAVEPSHIEVGQLLHLPAPSSLPTRPAPAADPSMPPARAPMRQTRHVVARGETLSALSRRYEVPVLEIQRVNRLEGAYIQAGQVLIIPAPVARED